jgi:hypothetical protein
MDPPSSYSQASSRVASPRRARYGACVHGGHRSDATLISGRQLRRWRALEGSPHSAKLCPGSLSARGAAFDRFAEPGTPLIRVRSSDAVGPLQRRQRIPCVAPALRTRETGHRSLQIVVNLRDSRVFSFYSAPVIYGGDNASRYVCANRRHEAHSRGLPWREPL